MSYQVIKQFLKSALMHVSRQKKNHDPSVPNGSEKFVTTPAFGRGSDKFAVFF